MHLLSPQRQRECDHVIVTAGGLTTECRVDGGSHGRYSDSVVHQLAFQVSLLVGSAIRRPGGSQRLIDFVCPALHIHAQIVIGAACAAAHVLRSGSSGRRREQAGRVAYSIGDVRANIYVCSTTENTAWNQVQCTITVNDEVIVDLLRIVWKAWR